MDKQLYGKKRLEEAICRYESTYYDTFPEACGEIAYSKQYLRKMNVLLQRSKSPFSVMLVGTARRAAAIILVIGFLCGGIFTVSGAHHSIAEWLVKAYHQFTEFFFTERDSLSAPTSVEDLYLPTYIPCGYTLHDRYLAESEAKTVWMNCREESILFVQTTLDAKTTVDNEHTEADVRYLGDMKFYVLRKKEKKCYYWNGKEYTFSLIVPDTIKEEICLMMISSVTISEKED